MKSSSSTARARPWRTWPPPSLPTRRRSRPVRACGSISWVDSGAKVVGLPLADAPLDLPAVGEVLVEHLPHQARQLRIAGKAEGDELAGTEGSAGAGGVQTGGAWGEAPGPRGARLSRRRSESGGALAAFLPWRSAGWAASSCRGRGGASPPSPARAWGGGAPASSAFTS